VKKSIDFSLDDHPAGTEDRSPVAWAVAVLDDCDGCDDLRVEVTLEEQGRAGAGVVAHLAPSTARRLRGALASALREVGEQPGA
jgi:hypothetical protein